MANRSASRSAIRYLAAFAGLATAAGLCWAAVKLGGADALSSPQPTVHRVPAESFRDGSGRAFRVAPSSGRRLVVLGYVGCASTCPLTLATVSRALSASPRVRDVDALFIDVDPQMDSGAAVQAFVKHFGGIRGVVPVARDVPRIESALGARMDRRDGGMIDHDARIFVVDAQGVVVQTLLPDISKTELEGIIDPGRMQATRV